MEWAADIFSIEARSGPRGLVRRIWRTNGVDVPSFISVAVPTWQIVFVEAADGSSSVIARGPETLATRSDVPKEAEIFGIQFEMGAFLTDHSLGQLVDRAEALFLDAGQFWLNGTRFERPTFENADVFVEHLARSGALVCDPIVAEAMQRKPVALSDRSIQRRFVRSTGITYGTVRQIERAERAAGQLRDGVSILDVVDEQGYSDQAHLTRSLRRYLGETPSRISKADR